MAIGIAAAVVASRVTPKQGPGAMAQTRRMLYEIRDEARAARAVTPDPALRRSLRETEAAIAAIAKVTGVSDWRALRDLDGVICQPAETAMVFLSTTSTNFSSLGEGSITILVSGNDGAQQFTFASGTSQANIIIHINTFREVIGVAAKQSVVNTARVEFRSLGASSSDFVRVEELNALTPDFIFASALSTTALDTFKDVGLSLITLSPFRP